MRTQRTKCESLTCGELARRWGVSVTRVHQLIEAGDLPDVFEIPAAGAFKRIVKIPMTSVLRAETAWSISPVGEPGQGSLQSRANENCVNERQ